MFDVDYFKKFNDTYGHDAGDYILRNLASVVKSNIRHMDMLIRYGGEEFLILAPESTNEEAFAIAERIRQEIEKTDFFYEEKNLRITISLGVASYRHALSPEEFIKLADSALYLAKKGGRNKTERCVQ